MVTFFKWSAEHGSSQPDHLDRVPDDCPVFADAVLFCHKRSILVGRENNLRQLGLRPPVIWFMWM